jgi:hypothetical protein
MIQAALSWVDISNMMLEMHVASHESLHFIIWRRIDTSKWNAKIIGMSDNLITDAASKIVAMYACLERIRREQVQISKSSII